MYSTTLYSIEEAASNLAVSEALVCKFIKRGFVVAVQQGRVKKVTAYGLRRLSEIIKMYEQSYTLETIEQRLNHQI